MLNRLLYSLENMFKDIEVVVLALVDELKFQASEREIIMGLVEEILDKLILKVETIMAPTVMVEEVVPIWEQIHKTTSWDVL